MAFDLNSINGFGQGTNGEIINPAGQINSYAKVTAIYNNKITIGSIADGNYGKFTEGSDVMVHVSTTIDEATNGAIGNFAIGTIISVNGSELTLDKNIAAIIGGGDAINYCYIQAIAIAQFTDLTLNDITISPLVYTLDSCYGGILAIKCSGSLIMNENAYIDTAGKGIPLSFKTHRPLTNQEQQGIDNYADYACWENHIAAKKLSLNAGDGVVFIAANQIKFNNTETNRIGNKGVTGARYTRDNRSGGSSIFIAADKITGFKADEIGTASSVDNGQGLGRCYIASNTPLPNDEAQYAYDNISDEKRLKTETGIRSFGNGKMGNMTNPTVPVNNYAKVTSIDFEGKILQITNMTTDGLAKFAKGSLVMFHVSKQKSQNDINLIGKFMVAKIAAINGSNVTLNLSLSDMISPSSLANYCCQLIAIPQFKNLTISNNYTATPKWDTTNEVGGVCVIACSNTLDLTDGQINVENKGGGLGYLKAGLNFIGNAQDATRLPLGAGHGSVLILAKKIIENNKSRIGATYSGANLGGLGEGSTSDSSMIGGGAGFGGGGKTGETNSNGTGDLIGLGNSVGIGGQGGYGSPGGQGGQSGSGGNSGSWGEEGESGRTFENVLGGYGGAGGRGGRGGAGGRGGTGGKGGYGAAGGKGGKGSAGARGGNGGKGGKGSDTWLRRTGTDENGSSTWERLMGGRGGTGGDGGTGGYGGAGWDGGNAFAGKIGETGPDSTAVALQGGNGGDGGSGNKGDGEGRWGASTGTHGGKGGTGGCNPGGSAGGHAFLITDGTNGVRGPNVDNPGSGANGVGAIDPGPDQIQGAHIMVIADRITECHLSAISSGGPAAGWSGWSFIYCNNVDTEDLTGVAV